jgi:hypothetical protein
MKTGHYSGVKKVHDWVVDQIDERFRTTHKVKTQHGTKIRVGIGDVELVTYLVNAEGPVPLVLDVRFTHDRFGSSSYLNLNGHLHYPNDKDKSLNDSDTVRLHSDILRLLFLQDHRETDHFFGASGVQFPQTNRDKFHFRVSVFSLIYSPITLANFSSINLTFIFRCSSFPRNPVYVRRVDSLVFVLSLS